MKKRTTLIVLGTLGFAGWMTMQSDTHQDDRIPSRSRPMEKAILTREIEPVRRLLDSGEDIDQKMFNEETPAIMAALTNDWRIVLYLLERGADPAAENSVGISVASVAANSRIVPGSGNYDALERVKGILRERGLLQ